MMRKRSISSVLDENPDRPYASPSPPSSRIQRNRTRTISGILEEPSEHSPSTTSHSGRLVACDCTKCNGKLVDYRTKVLHEINQNPEDSLNQNLEDNLEETEIEGHQPDETSPETQAESEFHRDDHQYESGNNENDETEFNFLPRQQLKRYVN